MFIILSMVLYSTNRWVLTAKLKQMRIQRKPISVHKNSSKIRCAIRTTTAAKTSSQAKIFSRLWFLVQMISHRCLHCNAFLFTHFVYCHGPNYWKWYCKVKIMWNWILSKDMENYCSQEETTMCIKEHGSKSGFKEAFCQQTFTHLSRVLSWRTKITYQRSVSKSKRSDLSKFVFNPFWTSKTFSLFKRFSSLYLSWLAFGFERFDFTSDSL